MSTGISTPHVMAYEVERAILSTLLSDFNYHKFKAIPSEAIFYDNRHKDLYRAINECVQESGTADMLSVTIKARQLDLTRLSPTFIAELVDSYDPAHGANFDTTCFQAWENAIRCRLLDITSKNLKELNDFHADIFGILNDTREAVDNINDGIESTRKTSFSDAIYEAIQYVSDMYDGRSVGLKTGIIPLDEVLGGFKPSDYIIVAARPGHGKTAFAVYLADTFAQQGKSSLMFSLEMSRVQMAMRFVSKRTGVTNYELNKKQPNKNEFLALMSKMSTLPLFINDKCFDIDTIISNCYETYGKEKGNLGAIFFDYIQLIEGGNINNNANARIGEISRKIKKLAMNLNVPVFVLSQLNRGNVLQGKKPQLHDLRDSGSLEQDANTVLTLHRYDYDDQSPEWEGRIAIDIKKNRSGAIQDFDLYHDIATNNFSGSPILTYMPNF